MILHPSDQITHVCAEKRKRDMASCRHKDGVKMYVCLICIKRHKKKRTKKRNNRQEKKKKERKESDGEEKEKRRETIK